MVEKKMRCLVKSYIENESSGLYLDEFIDGRINLEAFC